MFRFVRMRSSHARRFVPGRVLAPRAKRALVRLLHEILGLLARADQPAGHAVDLVAQLERLLFEANAVARLLGEPAGIRRLSVRCRSSGGHPSNGFNDHRALRIPAP